MDLIPTSGTKTAAAGSKRCFTPRAKAAPTLPASATYTRAKLDLALRRPLRATPPRDPNGHGTHCASIAAGNGRASNGLYCGVAPGADLIVAQSEPLFDDHTIWAIRKIFASPAAGRR